MAVFLIDLKNSDFAEGKGSYPVAYSARSSAVLSILVKVFLVLGMVATLGSEALNLYLTSARDARLKGIRKVTARVTGCEGPGRFQNIHVKYEVDGKPYYESVYWRESEFVGPSGMTDVCAGNGTVELNYLESDPTRWSIAPLSPLTRDDLQTGFSVGYRFPGPVLLLCAGIFWLTGIAVQNTREKQQRLGREGVILKAELIRARHDSSDESVYDIRCEYRFTNPAGVMMTGKSAGSRPDLKKEDYPPEGTPMLVLYVNDELFEAL